MAALDGETTQAAPDRWRRYAPSTRAPVQTSRLVACSPSVTAWDETAAMRCPCGSNILGFSACGPWKIRLTHALTSHSESRTDAFRMIRDRRDMARSAVLFAYECGGAARPSASASWSSQEGGAGKTRWAGAHVMTAERGDSHGKHFGFPLGASYSIPARNVSVLQCGRKALARGNRYTFTHRARFFSQQGGPCDAFFGNGSNATRLLRPDAA